MLEEDDRVVRPDGAFEQRLCISHCGHSHELHAWNGLEVGFQSLTVLRTKLPSHTTRPSDDDWHLQAASAEICSDHTSSTLATFTSAANCTPGMDWK